MDKLPVTDADRALLDLVYGGVFRFRPTLEQDVLEAIAAHRELGRLQGLEEAAGVAELWLEPIMATPHENDTYRSIATAIRALKG